MYIRARRIRAVVDNQLQHIRSRPYTAFRIVVFPVTEVLVYALITQFLVTGSVQMNDASFVVVGSLWWIVINEFQRGFTLAFYDLIYEHNLPTIWTAPIRLWEWFAGAGLSSALVTGLTGAVIVVTATALGVPILELNVASVLAAAAISGVLAIALSILVIVCVLRWGYGASELAWGLGAFLSPLSGAFVPVSQLPAVLQPIAQVLPTTMLFTALREAWNTGTFPASAFAIAFAAAVATLAATVVLLHYALRRFRTRVNVTRFI